MCREKQEQYFYNSEQEVHSQEKDCSTNAASGMLMHFLWNQFLHPSHCARLPYKLISLSHGKRHMQYTWIVLMDLMLLVQRLGFFDAGNSLSSPFSKHWYRCLLIWPWSKEHLCGSFPAHKATAKAMANRPQSDGPACICTLMYLDVPHSKWRLGTFHHCCNLPDESRWVGGWLTLCCLR